jgi:hypothetical protein
MAVTAKKIRIFVASPGDVQSERNELFKVISELNLTISALAPEKGIVLELLRWETHVPPGAGIDQQKVITAYIDDYDIFVGIMWKRLGTPTTTSQSGTEEEFQRAYSKWKQDKSFPVLFYFCQETFAPPRGREEVEQIRKVVEFREDIESKGLLVADYPDHGSFSDAVRPHLLLVLGKMLSSKDSTLDAAQRAGENTGSAEVSAVRSQIFALANEYEETRQAMHSGPMRTRAMALIASRMRSLALPAYPLLPELTASESSGKRLAAISILEAIPTPDYLAWLADRILLEKPFLGFHCTVALLQATRDLRTSNLNDVQQAVARAQRNLEKLAWKDPNQVNVLQNAADELRLAESKGI